VTARQATRRLRRAVRRARRARVAAAAACRQRHGARAHDEREQHDDDRTLDLLANLINTRVITLR
jgi:hypothetical protein